jgi:hypothetical protein
MLLAWLRSSKYYIDFGVSKQQSAPKTTSVKPQSSKKNGWASKNCIIFA